MNNTGEMLKARLRELRHKMKSATTAKEKEIIKHTANTCPVAKSLHPDLKQTLIFNF